ncbi:hypothetical protein FSARC_10041 [Fusarium sarcochroum]|uniref:Zn(2)-C6 fungal-type domain-containing protein n=1 Tax=Fusarium sarcochroum TaxID=1208366 RepID=A0A8H4TPN2_9HYPO|nr:hypothetical protein FSARC_10041 [Fusarium sarcochroum]
MNREREMTPDEEPPQKRQRILACRRCRGRKQRCEDRRPCTNCLKSGDQCVPIEPAPRPHVEIEYVRALEERVAELEKQNPRHSMDHLSSPQPNRVSICGNSAPRITGNITHGHATNGNTRSMSFNDRRPINILEDTSSSRRLSEVANVVHSGEHLSVSPADQTHSAVPGSHSNPSPSTSAVLSLDDNLASCLDHLIYGIGASPSICEDGRHSASVTTPGNNASTSINSDFLPQTLIAAMSTEVEHILLNAYKERAQAQYPMLHWKNVLEWLSEWKMCSPSELPSRYWQGFFINLIYSTALLLLSLPRVGQSDARTFYKQGMALLPYVLRQPSPILHVQAYLLLSIHALHSSSTSRLISLASTTMRYCVQFQFHLAETEPKSVDVNIRIENQFRRRCFWCAYIMDRLVMSSFELPPSMSDVMISAKVYANIDDEDLETVAARTSADEELPDSTIYTCVSSSLHILQCRRIQSEIFGYTLHWDYKSRYENSLDWRLQILSELENYKARVQNFTDPQSKGHTSQRWLAMIYHYTLLTLYRSTKDNVLGLAGDWSIQASSQACLIFRKSQMDRQIAQAWLGVGTLQSYTVKYPKNY